MKIIIIIITKCHARTDAVVRKLPTEQNIKNVLYCLCAAHGARHKKIFYIVCAL